MKRRTTEFQERVYAALSRVPRGRVTTYALLAGHIDCASPRAVGQALKRNPSAPRVPCHRVIASDLTVGGFAGCRCGFNVDRKLSILAAEGVSFSNGRLSDPGLVHRF